MDSSEIMLTAKEGRAEDLRDELRSRALRSLYYFSKVVLNYNQLQESFHLPLCQHIQETQSIKKRIYLAPRGHFKSTIIAKSYPLWRLCGGGIPQDQLNFDSELTDPRNLRILVVSENEDVASKALKDFRWNIENNTMLRWLFPEIIPPDIRKTKWTDTECLLPRTRSFDESTIRAIGVNQGGTGFHYDIIIYDDPIGLKASKEEKVMESAIEWFKTAPGLLDDQSKGEELMAGTRWKDGKTDLYGYVQEEMPFYKATDDRPVGFTFFISSCWLDEEKTQPVFPEKYSQHALEEIRHREGAYLFSCQYENDPVPKSGTSWGDIELKTFNIGQDSNNRSSLLIPSDGSQPVNINSLYRASFWDPSSGGTGAKCENAIVSAGMDREGRIFFFNAWSDNCGYSKAAEQWHLLNDQFLYTWTGYEKVGAQKEVEPLILARTLYKGPCPFCGAGSSEKRKHRRLVPIGIAPIGGKDKVQRIQFFLDAPLREGRVYFGPGTEKLKKQLTSFPYGGMVDVLDAGAYVVNNLKKPTGEEEEIEEQEKVDAIVMRSQRTFTEHNYGGYV